MLKKLFKKHNTTDLYHRPPIESFNNESPIESEISVSKSVSNVNFPVVSSKMISSEVNISSALSLNNGI